MVMRKIALLIGSDAHDTEYRHTRLREKFKDLPEFIDERILLDCMDKNAKAIIKNEEIYKIPSRSVKMNKSVKNGQ